MAENQTPGEVIQQTVGQPNQPVQQQQPQAPAAPTGYTPPPGTRLLTDAEFNTLFASQSRAATLEAERNNAAELARQETARALAAKGQYDQALEQTNNTWKQKHESEIEKNRKLTESIANEKVGLTIQSSITKTGRGLVNDHSLRLIEAYERPNLETVQDPTTGQFIVVHKVTREPAEQYLATRFASADYDALFKPKGNPGVPNPGSTQQAPNVQGPQYATMGDAMVAQMRTMSGNTGNADPRENYQAPGIGKTRRPIAPSHN